jgi:F-type H+-transporting ATPase subunit b
MYLAFAENSIQLVPDGTLFLHIVLIILMVFILNVTLFRPINKILEERERHTHGRSGEAREILKRVELSLGKYEHSLREARAEGYQLLERQRADTMSWRQGELNALREELNQTVEQEKSAIQTQAQQAQVNLESDTKRIAGEIGQQILGRPVVGA